jgi:hypothetical protein
MDERNSEIRVGELDMASPSDSAPKQHPWTNAELRTVVPTQQARQGATGHNVRYVLGFGLAGIVITFAVIYLVYFGRL